MTPLPKQRQSHGRSRRRRSADRLKLGTLVECSNCGEKHLAHNVCINCGHYNGREIFEVEKKTS